jgi:muconolactone D-isomerase
VPRFLVHITVELSTLGEHEREELIVAERRRGRALKTEGTIQDLWRLPGRLATVGIWRAPSATALHAALTSLPVWPYAGMEVTALADHDLTVDPEDVP